MKRFTLLFAALVLLASCRPNQPQSPGNDDGGQVSVNDTTVYGKSYEFGMSTFSIVTDAGDTLDLDRGEGHIFGNLDHEGDRFAVTVHGQGTDTASLGVAINLTNVGQFVADFSVCNGRLIISGDTVELLDLTADSLIAQGKSEYRLGK
ncbi:MAG: hypothetical protein IJ722_05055 [Alloprevotella sp.]|nr:hypothetical protein [Alloprevotella sp.]